MSLAPFLCAPLRSNIESQIATNLVGAIYLARSTAQRMISQRTPASPSAAQEDTSATSAASSAPSSQPRGGRLIFISSVIGLSGNSGQSVYAASKSGLHGLTLSLAKELASRRITVNCVCPGYVETEMTRSMPEQARQKILDKLPSGRMGTGEDVAHTVAHLCSPQANHVTGQIIAIAGGLQI